MRTTLSLDEDVLSVARAAAAAEGISLGEMVSRLARQGIASTTRVRVAEGDVPYFDVPPGASPITPEMVRQALDES